MTSGPRRGPWVLGVLLAAGVTAGVSVPVWVQATGTSPLEGLVPVEVPGAEVAPAILAAALVLLAAAGALALVGRYSRWVAVVVVLAAGGVVVATALGVLRDPDPVAGAVVAARTGVSVLTGPVTVTPWVSVAVVVGALDALLALVLARISRGWVASSRRHVPVTAAHRADADADPVDDDRSTWDAQTRGDDPSDT